MHDIADFRSDKCARPTPEMIRAMAACRWGDGQYDEGPTVHELERLAAKLTGKEAALLASSGVMANQLAVHAHTSPGEEVILDDHSHIFWTEGGTGALLSNVQTFALKSTRGMFCLEDLAEALSRLDRGARPALVCTENTHNFGGGRVMPLDYLKTIRSLASKRGAKVHLDGARIFNASVRSGIPVAKYAATADSLMFCLSKGLCAPVGSMLCGGREFIERARRFRERVGGMLKQPAPLARAGIIALTKMVPRLKKDHENTARFARGLHAIKGIDADLDIEDPETNMLFVTLKRVDGDRFVAALDRMGIRCYHLGGGRIRFAVHRDVDAADVDRAVEACRQLLSKKGR